MQPTQPGSFGVLAAQSGARAKTELSAEGMESSGGLGGIRAAKCRLPRLLNGLGLLGFRA